MAGRHSASHEAPAQRDSRSRRDEAEKRGRSSYNDEYDDDLEYKNEYYDYDNDSGYEEDDYEERPVRKAKKKKKAKRPSMIKIVIRDIIMTALILCIFAFFHHVLPRLTASSKAAPVTTAVVTPTPAPTTTPAPETASESGNETETEPVPETVEVTPDPNEGKTEWQIKFADKFTDEVVVTDSSYTSPDVSITVEKRVVTCGPNEAYSSNVYIADIYVAQIENFATCFAYGSYGYYAAENPVSLAKRAGALIAINGDYCNNQTEGFLVRNGEIYFTEQTVNDIAVLYYDGTMETYAYDAYSVDDIIARSPYQSWKFGPELLDSDGHAKESFNISSEISYENPRAGMGYYEPGHYCFIMVEGRSVNGSRGLTIDEFAQLFEELGCKAAYNVDGGASAVMMFNGKAVTQQSNARDLGEIMLICELPEAAADDEGSGN